MFYDVTPRPGADTDGSTTETRWFTDPRVLLEFPRGAVTERDRLAPRGRPALGLRHDSEGRPDRDRHAELTGTGSSCGTEHSVVKPPFVLRGRSRGSHFKTQAAQDQAVVGVDLAGESGGGVPRESRGLPCIIFR